MAEILCQAGRQFEPAVVEAFAELDHPTLLSRVRQGEPSHDGHDLHMPGQRSVHAYLTKPIDVESLLDTVRGSIGAPAAR